MTGILFCRECGAEISDDTIERALLYAHDCGYDEGYEEALSECEGYVVTGGVQCGNCGCVMNRPARTCPGCGAAVIGVVDEGESACL